MDEVRFAGQHDWRVTVFPPYALVVFILMSSLPALFFGWLISPNVGLADDHYDHQHLPHL